MSSVYNTSDGYWSPENSGYFPSLIKKKSSKTEGSQAIVDTSWQIPAVTTQLHKINQGTGASLPDLVENQIVGLRAPAGVDLYKVDFVSSHRPEHDVHDRVDMLVLSNILTKEPRTLTYWTDFESEILIPKAEDSNRLFVEDLLRPKIVVIGGDTVVSNITSAATGTSSSRHSWPAVKTDQKDLVRMEATENGEWKFWSIWKNGPRVYYHHGRIGEPSGNEGAYVGSSVRAAGGADAFMQRKIAEKQRKGYVKV